MTPNPRRTWRQRAATATLVMGIALAAAVHAQDITGTIFGTLTDDTGGVLQGVKVVIISVDNGQAREVITNNVGQYSVAVPVGDYEVSFQLPNFQPFTARGVSLHLNDRLRVNGRLIVGAVETLTVTAERLVQPTSAVQHLIPPVAVRDLPLPTRTPVQLVTLVPGVSSDLREDACFCDQGNLNVSIAGARRSAVNWLLDGASNVNGYSNYTLVTTPSLEAIQEINVVTSNYSAEWARNGGGVVNAVTKSGASRFSGSFYEFLRNDALNATPVLRTVDFRPQLNATRPRLRYNNFGYTVGGPALPSRRKLFFFFSEELRRSSREKQTRTSSVPDPRWLTDPASPNYVPPEARDPDAFALLALWPAPNVPGRNQYRATITSQLDTRQEFGRADYVSGTNWSFTGRHLRDRVDSRGEYATGPELAPGHRYSLGHLTVVDARRAGGGVLLESSYQLSSYEQSQKDAVHTRSHLALTIPELFPENAADLMPSITVAGLSSLGWGQRRPREFANHSFSAALTSQHGTHTLKAGGLVALEHVNANLVAAITQGAFEFQSGGGFTAFQNFLRGNSNGACGDACSYAEIDIDVVNRLRSRRYEFYAQDTWRMHSSITLDLGLRYAFYPPLTDDGNMLFTFSPAAYDPAQAPMFADDDGFYLVRGTGNIFNGIRVAGRDSVYGRAIAAADTNNLQPRVGAAWDPGGAGRLIIRAAYGVYFDQAQAGMFVENVQSSHYDPFRTELIIHNPSLSDLRHGTIAAPSVISTPLTFATSEQLVSPRWQHWNIGVQRRLYSGGMVDVGYLGARGDHLLRYIDINRPQPADVLRQNGAFANPVRPFLGYDQIIMRETTANSRYHGFTAGFRHEGGRGLWAMVNYTLSRNEADATYDNSFVDNPQNPLDKDAEFGAAATDRAQVFTASYVYRLPFGGEEIAAWRNALFGGWQLSGITRIESGPAARIEVINCNYGGWCFPGALRPNQIAEPGAGDQTGLLWFNPAAFVPSPAGEYGDAPVAPFRLPGRYQWDISLSKNVEVRGRARLQFRAEFMNAFNQKQPMDVHTTCGAMDFCDPINGFGQILNLRPPREVQLGVRLDW